MRWGEALQEERTSEKNEEWEMQAEPDNNILEDAIKQTNIGIYQTN